MDMWIDWIDMWISPLHLNSVYIQVYHGLSFNSISHEGRLILPRSHGQDIVICSDAFDVLVLGDPEEIIQKFQPLVVRSCGRSAGLWVVRRRDRV